ncbi:MAG: ClpX C4-type zinc finger protein [Planctomycetaceae bacterium]|nr:ClpX C4-type zinc finger protein [Planctomycetaceae bacterium]
MPTKDITPCPDDPVSPTTGTHCSFCGLPSNASRPLVESPDQSAYVCGDCALKSAYVVFAHKQTLAYKLVMGLIPLACFFALGGALAFYFLDTDFPMESHIGLGLIVLGFMTCQVLHFWWPNDDLLPRRPWF